MRSIQEEEPVLDPIGRSPSTTVPTPDAEYFGSPNDDRGFGPSFSYVAEQGRMAKGSDTEEEEEEDLELAWAKHTSIVTDYGEDVWVKPSPRLGVQLTAPEAMRGSRRNSKLARGTSDEVDDELEESHFFAPKKNHVDLRWRCSCWIACQLPRHVAYFSFFQGSSKGYFFRATYDMRWIRDMSSKADKGECHEQKSDPKVQFGRHNTRTL
eukprot:s4945_g1.t1